VIDKIPERKKKITKVMLLIFSFTITVLAIVHISKPKIQRVTNTTKKQYIVIKDFLDEYGIVVSSISRDWSRISEGKKPNEKYVIYDKNGDKYILVLIPRNKGPKECDKLPFMLHNRYGETVYYDKNIARKISPRPDVSDELLG